MNGWLARADSQARFKENAFSRTVSMISLDEAHRIIEQFKKGSLRKQISLLEERLEKTKRTDVGGLVSEHDVDPSLLTSALALKRAASQINEVVHSAGILLSLPYILGDGEIIESLSLAAGNTGKQFDLETNVRVAEFKFIDWKGGPESIRQNQLFKDFYWLAESETPKQRVLYVLGAEYPLRFFNGGRALQSVTSRNRKLWADFQNRYGTRFSVVREYYWHRKDRVQIVDLCRIVPYFVEGFE